MAYLDSSDHDDRIEEEGPGRRSQPARPAWDAATYGTPEDLRRSRPPARGSGRGTERERRRGRRDEAASADQPYPAESYPAAGEAYPSLSEAYLRADETYPGQSYAGGASPTPYSPEPYETDPYPASQSYAATSTDPYLPAGYGGPGSYPARGSYTTTGYATTESYAAAESFAATDSYYPAGDSFPDPFESDAGGREELGGRHSARGYDGEQPGQGYEGRASAGAAHDDDSARNDDRARNDPDVYDGSGYPGGDYPDEYPGGIDRAEERAPAPRRTGRAGRNLPAAIGVGLLLGGVALASLFIWRPAFMGVIALAIGVGIWELVRAIRTNGVNPPLIPLVAGGALMTGLGWWGQADALTFGLVVTVLAAMVWRLADGVTGYGRDVTAATLVAVYVPFLAGFAALLASPDDGGLRVLVTLACVVLSDTGGYIAGVLFGKHPMAPSVSPKKSWEGLAGSLVATAVGGALMLFFAFDVSPLLGTVFGLALAGASVIGDLGESMLKRDLGVKDMSHLLPGHGGLMDRLDSIIFAVPTAYALLVLMAPPL